MRVQNRGAVAGGTVACRLDALTAAENRERRGLADRLWAAVLSESSSGRELRWRLPEDAELHAAAKRLKALESRCCAFLEIHIESSPRDGTFELAFAGPDGTADLLRNELGLAARSGPPEV
jgi:hypothetical protein